MYTYGAESPDVQYAYITIAEFFSCYAADDARQYTQRLLKKAGSHRPWRGEPANVLYFLERLEGLVMAALTLLRKEGRREAAVVLFEKDEAPSLTAYGEYCGWHHKSAPWYFFPRHLTRGEYANPYRVFKQLAAKGGRKKWKYRLRELRFFTLSNSSLHESGDLNITTLELYLLLTKLIEAAHLIDVRAINEMAGEPRPKWAGLPLTAATGEAADRNTAV